MTTKTTPLHRIHKELGARMVDFAGWEMPVLYTGVIEEHLATRKTAGIFDVSHMGEIEVRGPQALEVVQKITCNDASRLKPGECQYSAFLTDQGTFVDDIIVNRLAPDHFLICVNASNTDKDFEWVKPHALPDTTIENTSDRYFQIALQGPEAEKIFVGAGFSGPGASTAPLPVRPFTFLQTSIDNQPVLIARTGYTGEDGFEIYGPPPLAEKVWTALTAQGAVPCGLGARDTLRLEAALPLYGHEIDDTTNPYEAGLKWIVKLDKGDFIGREALLGASTAPLRKKLVGIQMEEPGIARQGARIFPKIFAKALNTEKEIGHVTSGTKGPTLDRAIAMGYVANEFSEEKTKIGIDIHNKKRDAIIVSLPFFKRKK